MLQIISPGSDQAATLAHSRVGLSGSTRTERPVTLGSLSLLDDEHISSPMARSGAISTVVRVQFCEELVREVGHFRRALGLEGPKLSEVVIHPKF